MGSTPNIVNSTQHLPKMYMRKSALVMAAATTTLGQNLPYNPAHIFLSPRNESSAYILRPLAQVSSQAELLVLDYSRTSTSSPGFSVVSSTLPFLRDDNQVPYSPSMDQSGCLTVIVGDCAAGTERVEAWSIQTSPDESEASRRWWQHTISDTPSEEDASLASNFLARSISFSELVDPETRETDVFVFGGMCPSGASSAGNWQQNANYSNGMAVMSPHESASQAIEYVLSAVPTTEPLIAQAGATLTGLASAYSQSTTEVDQTQRQDFVLIGGHTQTAFVNTSSVAVFSLPQRSWSFVPVAQPLSTKSDLTLRTRQSQAVTPRSGHTAVLSESGDRIVVFGGWVGDVGQPASPQLAILDVGSGGNWHWNVPQQINPPADAGIYGHGAAMLPGNVMMIAGGYKISSSPATKNAKRDVSQEIQFYNVTSQAWITSYEIPDSYEYSTGTESGTLSDRSSRVGLGTGLGVGAALLLSVVSLYCWYTRRIKRARDERERTLFSRSSGASFFGQMEQPFLYGGGFDGRGGNEAAVGRFWPTASRDQTHDCEPAMQHSTGRGYNVPSPTRGFRKPVPRRHYQYHAAARYGENQTGGNIHSIAELAEEGSRRDSTEKDDETRGFVNETRQMKRVGSTTASNDPFVDPQPNPLRSHPVSGISGSANTRVSATSSRRYSSPSPTRLPADSYETPNWVSLGDPNGTLHDGEQGRSSPTRSSHDDRTSPTLSEHSQRSTLSNISITRTMSTRTGALLAAALTAQQGNASVPNHGSGSGERGRVPAGERRSPVHGSRIRPVTAGSVTPGRRSAAGGDNNALAVAPEGFVQLQSEGEILLGGRPALASGDQDRSTLAARSPFGPDRPGDQAQQRWKPGLMGSLRRVLNVVSLAGGERSMSLTGATSNQEHQSSSSPPMRDTSEAAVRGTPRRAVSDGAALFKQKRGRKDWMRDSTGLWPRYTDDPDPGDWGETHAEMPADAEDEWDVEGAAERRDVQVMFTVPKSRLRVVNDDMDRASLRSASDGAVSRNGSLKSAAAGLRSKESIRTFHAATEGGMLPAMEGIFEEKEKDA